MNAESVIARIDGEQRQTPRRDLTAENINLLNDLRNKTRGNLERLKTKRQAKQDDRSLSPKGQLDAIATVANDAISDYGNVARVLNRLETELANTTLFSVKPPVTEPVVRQLRNHETRDGLRGLNQNDQDVRFLHAAEQDDEETLDAMLDAPGAPLVSPDMKRRALDARAKRRQPEAYAQWEQTVLLRDEVKALLEHVALCLISMGADPKKVSKELGITIHVEDPKQTSQVVGDIFKNIS